MSHRTGVVAGGLLAMLVVASMPVVANAQARALTAADIPAELAPATRSVVARLADSLRATRLPSDVVVAKAAEGVLKGADDARILAAVRRLARALGEARVALGESADDAELVAAASALQAGVPATTLRRLRDAAEAKGAPRSSLATPLIVLADLVTRHVPATVAAAAIDSLLARRAQGADFAALRAAVERDIGAGRAPDRATALRARSLLDAMDTPERPPVRATHRPAPPGG